MTCHRIFQCLGQMLVTHDLKAWKLAHRPLGPVAVVLVAVLLTGCGASSNSGTSSFAPEQQLTGGSRTATGPNSPVASATLVSTSTGAYRIGPQDVLDISVFQVPELSKSVQVAETGTINLPLVGEVAVAGKTAQQVERDLTARLGAEYLQNPQVTVAVKDYNSQSLTISGAVNKPGLYPMRGKVTLMQAIAMAGDLEAASDSSVLILREKNGKRQAARFDVSAIQKGQAADPTLEGGDQIVAGTSAIKKGFGAILKVLPIAGAFALL